MTEVKLNTNLKQNYDDYYQIGDSDWRWLGAIDKAKNIETLCSGKLINAVVEIGAGEGSILKRLSDTKFAKELYALEISQTGITTIKNKSISLL